MPMSVLEILIGVQILFEFFRSLILAVEQITKSQRESSDVVIVTIHLSTEYSPRQQWQGFLLLG